MNRQEKIELLKSVSNGAKKVKRVLDIEACTTEQKSKAEKIISRVQPNNGKYVPVSVVTDEEEKFLNMLPTKLEII